MSDKEEAVISSPTGDGNTLPLLSEGDNGNLLEGNGKITAKGDHSDEAEEKLVPGDGKVTITSNKDSSEVKFNLSDSQNGDAKIDIEPIKMIFAGMGKEELIKFANDPFWVRLRWSLFVLFWLIWAAMLAGAIAIVVMAPKCASPQPLKWWEQGPVYQVYVRSFKDGSETSTGNGNLKGLISKLDYIEDIGVKGVTISSILKSSRPTDEANDDGIVSFEEIDPVFGSLDDFKNLLAEMKTRGLHLIMSFIINHSSNMHPWFVESERREKPYDDYYIWAPSAVISSDGNRIPPSNWLTVEGGSAWKWSEKRGEFYLHQFREDQPDLNFRNPAVVEEIKKVLVFWLDLGVDGFQFEKSQFLLEDSNFKNESVGGIPGKIHDEYDFYRHHQTRNLPEVLGILAEFKQVVLNCKGTDGFMSITGNTPSSWLEMYGNNSNVIDLPRNSSLLSQLEPGFKGEDLRVRIQNWMSMVPKGTFPGWQLSDWWTPRVASRLSEDVVDGLNMITMLLPGTPITLYGEEIGMSNQNGILNQPMQWDNSTHAGFSEESPWINVDLDCELCNVKAQQDAPESHLKVYKALTEARKSPSIMYGNLEIVLTANETVFAFTRIKSGNPGYLVAFNTGDEDVTANFSKLDNLSEELTVIMRSSNIQNDAIAIKSKWPKNGVLIPAKRALVLTFVPKKNE